MTPSVVCTMDKVGVQRYDDENSTYVHILNYHYNDQADRIDPLPELQVVVKGAAGKTMDIFVPGQQAVPTARVEERGEDAIVTLSDVGLYTVLTFQS